MAIPFREWDLPEAPITIQRGKELGFTQTIQAALHALEWVSVLNGNALSLGQ